MGAIEDVVKLFTVQKCVYWGNPVANDNGGWTFNAPVEIDCRWEDKQELKDGFWGNRITSQARVLVNIDIDRRGYMYNGTLEQLQEEAAANGYNINNPQEFPTAFIVIQFEKIPMVFANDDFVRTAFLYDHE
jgi:hypothetical protein